MSENQVPAPERDDSKYPDPADMAQIKKMMPTISEPLLFFSVIVLSVVGAAIGMQLIVTLGVTSNTSVLGALIAIIFSRIPIVALQRFRSLERQNLAQTAISSATFGAGNSLMIPIGVPYAMGQPELVMPMLIGATLAMFLDSTMLYGLFGSRIFPAYGTWPVGIATAEAIHAGDKGGRQALFLGGGLTAGFTGAFFGLPMSAFGVAFLGNMWALCMFGVGLLIRGYSKPLANIDLNALYVPHGFMVGAGLMALVQVVIQVKSRDTRNEGGFVPEERPIGKIMSSGIVAYVVLATLIAFICQLTHQMSPGMFVAFILFAAFAAYVHEIIVGIAAMHSGWFPAFAVALLTLIGGMAIGFPPIALGILAGYSASTGPAFADMGYDLKTGWLLRGKGKNLAFEQYGRRQQYIVAMVAFLVAAITVAVAHEGLFAQNLLPPVDRVYAATIKAGLKGDTTWLILQWAIPGAIIQLIGGPRRQLGVLLATGLLIANPNAGWAVLAGLTLRYAILRKTQGSMEAEISAMAGGFIAGDALFNFINGMLKSSGKMK